MKLTRESLMQHVRVARSGCWIWRRGRMGEGYGILKFHGVVSYAHRVVFELFHCPIPKGRLICHTCGTRPCVRPDHIYAGNHSTNMRDAYAHGRRKVRQVRAA